MNVPATTHTMLTAAHHWPSARQFAEAIQCPRVCFANSLLHETLPAFDRLGMPLVTSGQFAYVFKLKQARSNQAYAVRCFRGFLGDRAERYSAIDAHLRAHPLPVLAGFQYDAEGIFVGAGKYPTLVMEWIEGTTLDVYIEEILARRRRRGNNAQDDARDVLLHLADEWVRLIQAMREGHIAHGDLQHGNVIVEDGRLRLVDLDGLYVPAMSGWRASEIGHQHYQHPRRDEKLFNEHLDDFSALVIYLSLISLAERPALWAEHHDENLLFTKADYLAPEESTLFAKIKTIGPEHRGLAELLMEASRRAPADAPDLLAHVTAKSKLPAWMTSRSDLAVEVRTREATVIEVPLIEVAAHEARARRNYATRATPVTPGSTQVHSIFSGAAPQFGNLASSTTPTRSAPFGGALKIEQIMPASFYYTKRFGKAWIPFIWLWLTFGRHIYEFVGMAGGSAILLTALTFPLLCYLIGLGRATYQAREELLFRLGGGQTQRSNITHHNSGAGVNSNSSNTSLLGAARQSLWPHAYGASSPAGVGGAAATQIGQMTPTAQTIVASRTQGIYHRHSCDWALKISPGNRVAFAAPAEAQTAGYRRCKVCLP